MSDMRQMTTLGRSIEEGSFAIIDTEAGAHAFGRREWQVVRRVIHATADFDYFHAGGGLDGSAPVESHQVGELAVGDPQQRGHLVVVDAESDGDDVVVEAVVSEPDRHCVQVR